MASEEAEYYAYSSDEEGYSSEVASREDEEEEDSKMQWEGVSDNPNAAPMDFGRSVSDGSAASALKSGIHMMNAEEIRPEMRRRWKEVTEVLGISPAAATVLLQKFKWSKERLLEAYMSDPDSVLKAAGVYHRCGHTIQHDPADKTCPICYDESDTTIAMPCGHAFCSDCWYDFCVNAVSEGPMAVRKTCPHAGCPEMVTEDEMERALGGADSADFLKYQNYQLRSFVESNALTRWCPGPGCERVACALTASAMEAEGNVAHCDSCSTAFCLVCGNGPHAPCSCRDLLRWLEKCRNESETANWILANTKECPKCVTRIEKNNGCNHMTCQRCSHEFCWICMGNWHDHGTNTGGYYKCNKYDAGSGDDANDTSDSAKARRQLNRYLHFYKRYHAHSEGQKFAQKQLRETEQRMVMLQESTDNAKWTDVEFLKTANELLVECRRVLKFTYVYAYYLDPERAMLRERFEYHQEMLERFTENLSELSEKPLHQMDRTDVVNQTRVVDRFMRNILQYVEDGMEDE